MRALWPAAGAAMTRIVALWRDLDPAERLARLRSLRAIVHLTAGGAGTEAERAMAAARARHRCSTA